MTHDAPRHVATIDIGTNSVLLLVAAVGSARALTPVRELATITRLGQDVDRTRTLQPEAVERTLACLADYAGILSEYPGVRLDVVGTSAMRDAGGGAELCDRAERLLGVRPRTISGDEEATLTFSGGLSGIDLSGPALVFDIGGGSTEFIRGDAPSRTITSATSLDIGSVRLTERHLPSDPPSLAQVDALLADLDHELDAIDLESPATLVGVAGTVTSVFAIARGLVEYDARRVHGQALETDELRAVRDRLIALSTAERCRLPGLSPKRADVIAAGACLLARIAERAGAARVIVSDRGVRWGLAERLAT